jgi:hypothetical protein
MDQIPAIEDLVGISGIDSDLYFDHREFEARAWLEDEHYWHLARREVVLEALQAALSVDNANVLAARAARSRSLSSGRDGFVTSRSSVRSPTPGSRTWP